MQAATKMDWVILSVEACQRLYSKRPSVTSFVRPWLLIEMTVADGPVI
jgi:hypothetical protein